MGKSIGVLLGAISLTTVLAYADTEEPKGLS